MNLQIDPGVREQFRVRVEDGVKKNILAKKPVMIGIAAVALIGFVLLLSGAWNSGGDTPEEGGIPVVQAEEGPLKVKPAEELAAGADVGQNAMVYNQLAQGGQAANAPVENLLPPPEAPMQPPQPVELSRQSAGPVMVSVPSPASAPETAVQAAPAPKAEPQAKAPGDYRVQIGSLPSKAKAEAEWARLRKKFPKQLGSLEMHLERADLGAKGVYYRIQAGPLSESAAKKTCLELKAGTGGCIVVRR